MANQFSRDACVIGGGGHVGLPLALTFADCGLRTLIYDTNQQTVDMIRRGEMPFMEDGGTEMLRHTLATELLEVASTPELMDSCEFIVLIIGTPVDKHLNPDFTAIHRALDACRAQLRDGQVLILRSTIFPGISQSIAHYMKQHGLNIEVAFCPERVAEGHSIKEFRTLPQIISAFDPKTVQRVKKLFSRFTKECIEMTPIEAELCKLMTNAWRYLQFAAVNQFYMIATQNGANFERILHGCRHNYPRMAGMPGAGFAAGPCLVKDTMQLASFSQNNFVLGHAAMLINEGLPGHLVQLAKQHRDLRKLKAGIIGMAFKAEIDDPRDSLSYKLRKLLQLEAAAVLCTDEYVKDDSFVSLETVLEESDILFVGAPHNRYRGLACPPGKILVDVWNIMKAAEPHSNDFVIAN